MRVDLTDKQREDLLFNMGDAIKFARDLISMHYPTLHKETRLMVAYEVLQMWHEVPFELAIGYRFEVQRLIDLLDWWTIIKERHGL